MHVSTKFWSTLCQFCFVFWFRAIHLASSPSTPATAPGGNWKGFQNHIIPLRNCIIAQKDPSYFLSLSLFDYHHLNLVKTREGLPLQLWGMGHLSQDLDSDCGKSRIQKSVIQREQQIHAAGIFSNTHISWKWNTYCAQQVSILFL